MKLVLNKSHVSNAVKFFASESARVKKPGPVAATKPEAAKAQQGATVENLLIVNFPETESERDLWKSFSSVFYVTNRKASREIGIVKDDYLQYAENLAYQSAVVNSAFYLLRYIAINANRLSAHEDGGQADIKTNWLVQMSSFGAEAGSTEAFGLLNSIASGNGHIIKETDDGFDVMFSGIPGSGIRANTTNSLPLRPSTIDSVYEGQVSPTGAFSSTIGKAAIQTAKALLKRLTSVNNADQVAGASKRVVTSKAIDFSAVELVDKAFGEFYSYTNIKLPSIDLKPLAKNITNGIGRYVKTLVLKEAHDGLVRRKLAAPDRSDDTFNFPPELDVLDPTIAFSFSVHIPLPVARYIAQAPVGEQPSLVSLNTWVNVWASNILRQGRKGRAEAVIKVKNIPRYVIPASKTKELIDKRKSLGYYTEPGRVNDEGIFISNNGTLNYLPKSDDLVLENAVRYEKLMEESLRTAFDAGTPLLPGSKGVTNPVFALHDPEYAKKIEIQKTNLRKYCGSMQAFSWDYNVVLTTSVAEPDKVVSIGLGGSAKASPLFIADYMRKPFAQSMQLMFTNSNVVKEDGQGSEGQADESTFGHMMRSCVNMIPRSSVFVNTLRLYQYLNTKQAVPAFSKLVAEAANDLKISSLEDEEVARYEKDLYTNFIQKDLSVLAEVDQETHIALAKCLASAILDAEGGPRSNLSRAVFVRNQQDGTDDPIEDDPRYFNSTTSALHEFGNVFQYLGGKVFQLALRYITKVDKKAYLVVDPDSNVVLPPFNSIVTEVMPFALMFAKYVPEKDEVFKQADAQSDTNVPDDRIDEENIKLPGSRKGFQLFPHQVNGFKQLGKFPAFAILDVSPGGGKTTSILTDIGMMLEAKKASKFLVMCPTRLAKNWIEDMHKHTEGKWNFIPLTTEVYNRWGEEKLAELIEKAPRNTIVVVGNDWLSKTGTKQIVIGRHVERISTSLEFVKRFGFEYIAIDESHRIKRMHPTPSNIHRMVKQLTTASCVKYIRLATGSLINNVLMDVVGQTALYNAAIFRTPAEFEEANKRLGVGLGGRTALVYMAESANKARQHLSKYATVITVKRREWAFMLPIPKETFSFVPLSSSNAEGIPDNEADEAHKLMYEALFKSTLEDIKSNKELMDLLMGKNDEGGEDDEEGEDDEKGKGKDRPKDLESAIADAMGQDEDVMSEMSQALTPYLQRLEMSITDPIGDVDTIGNKFGAVFFKGIHQENYVSAKVRKVIQRIEMHYEKKLWVKGTVYKKDDIADHANKRFIYAGDKPSYTSLIPPTEDSDNWKPQAFGKVLIFCRYTRSVEAIYRALPERFKAVAKKFHGDVENKWSGLEEFKTSPVASPYDIGTVGGVQIFVANEQAISEGHNLQMASRMIRVELPWAPGDLDQSAARIFRPDVSGKNARDFINLDWVIGEGTLEVAKLGCLISKIMTKTQFDEAGNDFKTTDSDGNTYGYSDINKANLPPIKMSLKNIENLRWRSDLFDTIGGVDIDYLGEYANLVQLQGADFLNMRKTRQARMLDIEPTPMPEDCKRLEFQPYVEDLDIPDPNSWGLKRLNLFMESTVDPQAIAAREDKSTLIGKYVHTDFGNGVIVGTRSPSATGRKGENEEVQGDNGARLTSVKIQLAGTGELITRDPSLVFLAQNLTEKTAKLFAPKERWMTARDAKRLEQEEQQRIREEEREARRIRAEVRRERTEIDVVRRQVQRRLTGDDTPRRKPKVEEVTPTVSLYPVVYNGYLAIEGKSETEEKAAVLKKFGFRPFGDYAYIKVNTWKNYDAILNFLDKKFFMSDRVYNTLVRAEDAFVSGRGRKFDVEQAPIADFKNFYIMSHKQSAVRGSNGKPELKVYPMVIDQTMFFVVDVVTNPAAKKLIGYAIPECTTKFGLADGMFISFFTKKTEMRDKVLEIKNAGIEIENYEEFKDSYKGINLGTAKPVKREEDRVERKVKPAATKPAAKEPVAKKPAAKTPVKPVAKTATKPVAKKPAAKTPAKPASKISIKPTGRTKKVIR